MPAECCRDCGVALTVANVWEPGTCLNCAKKLKSAELHGPVTAHPRPNVVIARDVRGLTGEQMVAAHAFVELHTLRPSGYCFCGYKVPLFGYRDHLEAEAGCPACEGRVRGVHHWTGCGSVDAFDYDDEHGSSHIKPCPHCGAGTDESCDENCTLVTGKEPESV